jgi:hypothetical protein
LAILLDAPVDDSLSLWAMGVSAPFAAGVAHHVSGTVCCDQDWSGSIDAGDTPVAGVKVVATSLAARSPRH